MWWVNLCTSTRTFSLLCASLTSQGVFCFHRHHCWWKFPLFTLAESRQCLRGASTGTWLVIKKVQLALSVLPGWLLSFQCTDKDGWLLWTSYRICKRDQLPRWGRSTQPVSTFPELPRRNKWLCSHSWSHHTIWGHWCGERWRAGRLQIPSVQTCDPGRTVLPTTLPRSSSSHPSVAPTLWKEVQTYSPFVV